MNKFDINNNNKKGVKRNYTTDFNKIKPNDGVGQLKTSISQKQVNNDKGLNTLSRIRPNSCNNINKVLQYCPRIHDTKTLKKVIFF